ncbi:efflux RND transporter periplasmic adaptor subunit [Candidatus Cyanaurora vandensis]|uniref:efflux RND transporter periplasmic adaptor subunit n=1 Tax=Candidatus Cyanaurora vandensis TaxID=2714958 RepID=UPI00257BC574|nr:efflux RND transporter periplasmic adaptor subunit [Candidatus Cyanaurora vandensis]
MAKTPDQRLPPRSVPWVPLLLGLLVIGGGVYFLRQQVENAEQAPAPRAKPAIPVTSAVTQQRAIPVQITSVGNVEAAATVAVRSQVEGQLLKVHFRQGELVRQGQVLFSIDPRTVQANLLQTQAAVNQALASVEQARALLVKDQAQLRTARTQLARYEQLYTRGAISQDQLDQYRTNVDALVATVRADEANIRNTQARVNADLAAVTNAQVQLGYTTIRAPISGRAGDLLFDSGNLIRTNDTTPLVTINQINPIYVSFTIPEVQLANLRAQMTKSGLKVTVRAPNATGTPTGNLTFVNNAVDPTTGTIQLKATFANRDNYLVPGQFVDTTLTLNTLDNAIVVPSQAVQTGQKGLYVFVIKPDQLVEERSVTSKLTYQGLAVIDQGLRPGEVVVTDGQLQLVPGAKVQSKS